MQTATCIVLGMCLSYPARFVTHCLFRRAGRFGTKGLAITFVSSDSDQQVMAAIQLRFEVAVPELPDHIDPASYSKYYPCITAFNHLSHAHSSDVVVSVA